MLSTGLLVCMDAIALVALLLVWDWLQATLISLWATDDILLHNVKEWGLCVHNV